MKKLLFIVTEDEYFFTHRLQNAIAAVKSGFEVAVLCNNTQLKSKISSHNIKFFDWKITRGSINIFKEIKSIFYLYKCIRKYDPNLIHSVSWKPFIYVSFINYFLNKKHLIALGGLGYFFISQLLKDRLIKSILSKYLKIYLYKKDTYLLLQNINDKNFLFNNPLKYKNKIFIIEGVGVDDTKFKINKSKIISQKNIILYAGRLLLHKGINDFYDLAIKIKKINPNIRFVLVGKIDKHNPSYISNNLLNDWIKTGNIEWWGYKNNMQDIFPDALFTCHLSSREGFSKSLIESFSCGIPAIGYDVPGINNIINHKKNGILVEFGNKHQLFNEVNSLISDYKKIEFYGNNCKNLVSDKYNLYKINHKFVQLWINLIR